MVAFDIFETTISDWMSTYGLLYKTYSYERAEGCYTVEIYTSKDPIDGIYVMLDEFQITMKVIQRHTLSTHQFDDLFELMSKVHYLIEDFEQVVCDQKKYEAENPTPTAQIIEFKRSE